MKKFYNLFIFLSFFTRRSHATAFTTGQSVQVDISKLSSGFYTVKISSGNLNEVRRLVVQ